MPILRAAEPLPRRPSAQLRSSRWPRRPRVDFAEQRVLPACATPGGSASQATRRVQQYVARERVVTERDVRRVDRLRVREPLYRRRARQRRDQSNATSPDTPARPFDRGEDGALFVSAGGRVGRVTWQIVILVKSANPRYGPIPRTP